MKVTIINSPDEIKPKPSPVAKMARGTVARQSSESFS